MKTLVAGPILRLLLRPDVSGEENIPRTGPLILASNHLSYVDPVILPLMIRRRIHFLAKSDYYTGKGFANWAVRNFLKATGMIPIDRSGGKASEASLKTGLKALGEGKVLGIYPEGTRSPDGRLYRGRTGVARLILEGEVTVVPVAMFDTDKVMGVGSSRLSLHKIGIKIGKPVDLSSYLGKPADGAVLRSIANEITSAIQTLSGQEFVDTYASSARSKPVA